MPLGPGQPPSFLHALGERDDWTELTCFGALLVDLYALFTSPACATSAAFYGPAERFLRDSGANIEFVPADFRRFAPIARARSSRASWPRRRAARRRRVREPVAARRRDRRRAARAPAPIPTAAGRRDQRTASRAPSGSRPSTRTASTSTRSTCSSTSDRAAVRPRRRRSRPTSTGPIAEHVRPFIPDGSTLQTGIGAIPSHGRALLAEGDGGDYGIHSEMFTTGLMHLHQAGKVTNARKGSYDGVSVTTFAAGTAELYEWLDGNHDVRVPARSTSSTRPRSIARNHDDGHDQRRARRRPRTARSVADTIGGRQYSGIGGHEDFVAGRGLELEDRSLVCLPSTAMVGGRARVRGSSPRSPAGAIVTTPRHQLDVVVTEYGVAELRGRTVQRAGHGAGRDRPPGRSAMSCCRRRALLASPGRLRA